MKAKKAPPVINRGRVYVIKAGSLRVHIKAMTASDAMEEAKERVKNCPNMIIVGVKEVA